MGKRKDLTGVKFGKLTVVKHSYSKDNIAYWECVCECGNKSVVRAQSLITHRTNSCGCISRQKSEDLSKRRRENTPNVCAIYKITNPNNAVYIGSSKTVYKRWLRHREGRKNTKLHESIRTYGWMAHKFEIAHELPLGIDKDKLIEMEQVYIDLYRDCNCIMLNIKDAGSKAKFSEESKIKMSLSKKGKIPWNKGKKIAK